MQENNKKKLKLAKRRKSIVIFIFFRTLPNFDRDHGWKTLVSFVVSEATDPIHENQTFFEKNTNISEIPRVLK